VADARQARLHFDRHAAVLALILVDTILPDESGLEFVQDLPNRSPRIPIIFLNGSGEAEGESPARQNFPVVQKPFTFWQLMRGVKAAIARFYVDAKNREVSLRAG
jgi:FixJ family two-component response regulator